MSFGRNKEYQLMKISSAEVRECWILKMLLMKMYLAVTIERILLDLSIVQCAIVEDVIQGSIFYMVLINNPFIS